MKEQFISSFISIPSTFRLLFFDDEKMAFDESTLTKNSYDPLIFSRLITAIPYGIGTLPVILTSTYSFIFPAVEQLTNDKVYMHSNRIAFLLLLGGIDLGPIHFSNIQRIPVHSSGFFRLHKHAGCPNCRFIFSLQQHAAGQIDLPTILYAERDTESTAHLAFKRGAKAIEGIEDVPADLLLEGLMYFKTGEYHKSISMLWSCIEILINVLWKRHADTKPLFEGRKKFLDSSQWTAAHKIELLFQTGKLSNDGYICLSKARIARNKLIHGNRIPERTHCHTAIDGLCTLLGLLSRDDYNFKSLFTNTDQNIHIRTEPSPLHKGAIWRACPPLPGESGWNRETSIRSLRLTRRLEKDDLCISGESLTSPYI